jgi:2-(3-amino-3-carboxypropyl)histidine synthase
LIIVVFTLHLLFGEERVIAVDPYTGGVRYVDDVVRRVLMKRFWTMRKFVDARNVGIIVGGLPGQHRPGVVDALVKLARRRAMRIGLLYAERLTREMLDNLDPGSYDAYIVTSCPRLAIEDFDDYWKPVLAPGEARIVMLYGKPVSYAFTW